MGAHSTRAARWTITALALLLLAACAKVSEPNSSASPTGTTLSLAALKLTVLEAVGGYLAYCDPDLYPVAKGDALSNAKARLPMIRADHAAFAAILGHEGLAAGQHFTSTELMAMSDDYKQMQAIDLRRAGDGYGFELSVPQRGSDVGVWDLSGTVSPSGVVKLGPRKVGQRPACPKCLAFGVRIATPSGETPVQDIRVGMAVWTTDVRGRRIVGTVLRTGHMEAPLGHEVVRLVLSDGRSVDVSPGHPTVDGRTVGDLRSGDRFDDAVVTSVVLVPYTGATWDLLPSGATGAYFANGVLLGSTLRLRATYSIPAAPTAT